MSGIKNKVEQVADKFYQSGAPGTTGRENFEDSSATGPGSAYSSNTADTGTGTGAGGLTGGHHGSSGIGPGNGTGGLSSETTARSDLGLPGTHGQQGHSASTGATGAGIAAAAGEHGHHGHHAHHGQHGIGSAGTTGYGSTTGTGTGAGYDSVGSGERGAGSGLNTLGGGQNTTSTGLTGSTGQYGQDHEQGLTGGHRSDATRNTAEALGAGAVGTGVGSGNGHGGHHGHHGHHGQGHPGTTGIASTGSTGTAGTGAGLSELDKVGSLNQNAGLYERTGAGGPATSGAAGTDRFDTGKHHSGDVTSQGLRGETASGSAEGESRKEHGTGGFLGAIGTSDKDFLSNRGRVADSGAYADDQGIYKTNTSGPGGNTALTGREGTLENNPVAQSQSRGAGATAGTGATGLSSGAHGTGVEGGQHGVDEHGQPHKKGLMEKVKDALS